MEINFAQFGLTMHEDEKSSNGSTTAEKLNEALDAGTLDVLADTLVDYAPDVEDELTEMFDFVGKGHIYKFDDDEFITMAGDASLYSVEDLAAQASKLFWAQVGENY